MTGKKRYAAIGTGHRVAMFVDPIARDYREYADLAGLCDLSLTRAFYHRDRLQREYSHGEVPVYAASILSR